MKKKFRVLSVALLALMLLLVACGQTNDQQTSKPVKGDKFMKVDNYNVGFYFTKSWETVKTDTFDLQCTNGLAYASLFAYTPEDLEENQSPLDIFVFQNEDLMTNKDNIKIELEDKVQEFDDKTVYSVLFSGDYEGTNYYYYSNMVIFKDSDTFAWIVFSALPSYGKRKITEWDAIATSAEITVDKL